MVPGLYTNKSVCSLGLWSHFTCLRVAGSSTKEKFHIYSNLCESERLEITDITDITHSQGLFSCRKNTFCLMIILVKKRRKKIARLFLCFSVGEGCPLGLARWHLCGYCKWHPPQSNRPRHHRHCGGEEGGDLLLRDQTCWWVHLGFMLSLSTSFHMFLLMVLLQSY